MGNAPGRRLLTLKIPGRLALVASVCLTIHGCSGDEAVSPNGRDGSHEPVCPAGSPWVMLQVLTPAIDEALDHYPPRIAFSWYQAPEYKIARTRYLLAELEHGRDGISILNDDPAGFAGLWSGWVNWDPAGHGVIAGQEESLEDGGCYLFAVQAMDSCGKITNTYGSGYNARQFEVLIPDLLLTVSEPTLGSCTFSGTSQRPEPLLVLANAPFFFYWYAESSLGPVEYRYGWDIQNLDEDHEWMESWRQGMTEHWRPVLFSSGIHTLYVEARDDIGTVTRGRVELEVIPFTRERDVLWIDDFRLESEPLPDRSLPGEDEHDAFWTGMCSIAPDFDPVRDIFEADLEPDHEPVPLRLLARYKSIVWTYDNQENNLWSRTIVSRSCTDLHPCCRLSPNNLSMFLKAGGNALTCGRGDLSHSALGATFPEPPGYPVRLPFDSHPPGVWGDEDPRAPMARNDYYVTIVDKVLARYTDDLPGGVIRDAERDAFVSAQIHSGFAEALPLELTLREEITQPGMFFDPAERGFWYVEVYDPQYYMEYKTIPLSHECFSPIYTMRTRSTLSPLNGAAVAIWTMNNRCESEHPFWLPAYHIGSAHFGLPLWFMNPEQTESIVAYIFDGWGID